MKRYGNLWSDIIAFANLFAASRKAQRGKRFRENVLEFNYNLEQELFQLQAELHSKTYCPRDNRNNNVGFRVVVALGMTLRLVRTGECEFIGRTKKSLDLLQ